MCRTHGSDQRRVAARRVSAQTIDGDCVRSWRQGGGGRGATVLREDILCSATEPQQIAKAAASYGTISDAETWIGAERGWHGRYRFPFGEQGQQRRQCASSHYADSRFRPGRSLGGTDGFAKRKAGHLQDNPFEVAEWRTTATKGHKSQVSH